MPVYWTLGNGGRAFEVEVDGARVVARHAGAVVYACEAATAVLVGDSPDLTGLLGNSILVEEGVVGGAWTYVCVGSDVRRFAFPCRAARFESPVFGSVAAFPYAVDAAGATHLLVEGVTLGPQTRPWPDPYDHYYRREVVVGTGADADRGNEIVGYWVGDDAYELTIGGAPVDGRQQWVQYRGRGARTPVDGAEVRRIQEALRAARGWSRLASTLLAK